MPDGVLQWFDPATGEGRILHAGRRFSVQAAQMAPSARTPGARVHFDIDPDAHDIARDVTLRRPKRAPRRRRIGDLAGSRTPDTRGTAPFAKEHNELGRDLQHRPMRVAQQWSALMAAGDLDKALLLYAPDATLHAEGDVTIGHAAIRRVLARCPVLGDATAPSIRGDDSTIVLRWPSRDPGGAPVETQVRIAHGEIAEQWIGAIWTAAAVAEGGTPIQLSTSGEVSDADRAKAIDKIGAIVNAIDSPVLHTGIRLQHAADPARDRPATARVTVDVDGEAVRATVSGHTMAEAIDLLDARLRQRLERLAEHRITLRRRGPTSPTGEWRHGDPPSTRPTYFPRPADEREVVRHKSSTTVSATVDEAIFDLEAMDHDFFLFNDLGTGQDAVVFRRGGGAYGVRYLDGPVGSTGEPPWAAAVEVNPAGAPPLSLREARERLDAGDEPWVFFADTTTKRGHVLYRRYDGHYGLITPVDEAPAGPEDTELDLEWP